MLAWFRAINDGPPTEGRSSPGNFVLIALPDPYAGGDAQPIAPYESDASQWLDLEWIDRRTGRLVRITVSPDGIGLDRQRVRTYRDIASDYLAHPEAKSLAPDGSPVGRNTRGVLLRRPVHSTGLTRHIGKEGNRIDERIHGLVASQDCQTSYPTPLRDESLHILDALLSRMTIAEIAQRTGVHRRTLERIRSRAAPRPRTVSKLREIASSSPLEDRILGPGK